MMASKHFWRFPDNSGQIIGITSTKMDNKDSKQQTFTKEICQNSTDANKVPEPAIIEFNRFEMPISDYPSIEEYRRIAELCVQTATNEYEDNNRIVEVFKEVCSELNGEKMLVLRVSDYNTTGLTGSKSDRFNTPWRSLTVSKGISDKSGSSGGSFGRGKDSYYEMSKVRAVFFSTLDKEGISASIGCSSLMTFKDGSVAKSHFGYCGADDKGTPIGEQISFPSSGYKRTEVGTDIYIMGYADVSDDWDVPIILSVIRDFFVCILDGKLIVRIGKMVIDKDTIGTTLKYLFNKMSAPRDQKALSDIYELIDTMRLPPIFDSDTSLKYELHMRKSDTCNRVISVRSGMTISSAFFRSRKTSLVGAIIVRDSKVSEALVDCENVSHNAWNVNNLPGEKGRIASGYIQEMKEFIYKQAEALSDHKIGERVDAAGLGRFLFSDKLSPEDAANARKDSQFAPITEVAVKKQTGVDKEHRQVEGTELKPAIPPEDTPFKPSSPTDSKDREMGLGTKELVPATDSPFKRRFPKSSPPEMKNVRTICIDRDANMYQMWFDADRDGPVCITMYILLEGDIDGDKAIITNAQDALGEVRFSHDRIGPFDVKKDQRNYLLFTIDYPMICSLRPEVIGDGQ